MPPRYHRHPKLSWPCAKLPGAAWLPVIQVVQIGKHMAVRRIRAKEDFLVQRWFATKYSAIFSCNRPRLTWRSFLAWTRKNLATFCRNHPEILGDLFLQPSTNTRRFFLYGPWKLGEFSSQPSRITRRFSRAIRITRRIVVFEECADFVRQIF